MNDYTSKALESWYKPDNPLYRDPRHPLIKLAGEAGELLDLYGKHEYKPNFSWWNCKNCDALVNSACDNYTPLVLDELGDWWYYARIVAWQQNISLNWMENYSPKNIDDMFFALARIAVECANLAESYALSGKIKKSFLDARLTNALTWFLDILHTLDCTLDHLTDLNYRKLNSDASQHGWSEAR